MGREEWQGRVHIKNKNKIIKTIGRNVCITNLINTLHENAFLILYAQIPGLDHIGLEDEQHDWVIKGTGAYHPVATRVELSAHGADVLTALDENVGVGLQQVDRLASRHGHHGGQGSRVGIGRRGNTLVLDDVLGAGTEAASGAERARERTDDHIDLLGIHVLSLGKTTAGTAQDTKGPCLIEDDAELVLLLELDKTGQIRRITNGLKQTFGNDETTGELLSLCLLGSHALHDTLEPIHITMIEPANAGTRGLQTLTDRVVNGAVSDDDIATLAEGGDTRGRDGEGLGVDDAALGAEEGSNVGLGADVDILGAIELGRTAGADAVGAQGLDGLLLDLFVGVEVVEVVRGEVGDGTAVGELRLGAGGTVGVGLARVKKQGACAYACACALCESYPTMTGILSLSASSKAVLSPTRGSGAQSSINSSISYKQPIHVSPMHRPPEARGQTHFLPQLDVVLLVSRVRGGQQIADEEENKDQLDGRAHGIVLVTGADVAHEDGRAGHLLEGERRLLGKVAQLGLQSVELHCRRSKIGYAGAGVGAGVNVSRRVVSYRLSVPRCATSVGDVGGLAMVGLELEEQVKSTLT